MDNGESARIHTESLPIAVENPPCAECGQPVASDPVLYGDRPFHTYTELVAWKRRKEAV